MRLTVDALLRAEQYLNAWKDRELNLRGMKIPAIENIAILQDEFDCIDFSDNEIRKLNNFPSMKRLSTIILCNNYISRVEALGHLVINLTTLILTNNKISNLGEVDNIATFSHLEHLSLLENPVTFRPNYRFYVIHKIPSLKSLDFNKISKAEREAAQKYFKSVLGKAMLSDIATDNRTLADGETGTLPNSVPTVAPPAAPLVLTEEQKQIVREAIQAATTKEEVDAIEKSLKNGTFFDAISSEKVSS